MLAVLPGGWLADRVDNHERVLGICFLASGALLIIAGVGVAPFWLAIALVGASGALRGLVNASRDVSVRHAATNVSVGTLFGFVTTGFAGGQILGPGLYGWLIDAGHPQLVFWASAGFSTLAIASGAHARTPLADRHSAPCAREAQGALRSMIRSLMAMRLASRSGLWGRL